MFTEHLKGRVNTVSPAQVGRERMCRERERERVGERELGLEERRKRATHRD